MRKYAKINKVSRKFKNHILSKAPWHILVRHRAYFDGEYGVVDLNYTEEHKMKSDCRLKVSLCSFAMFLVGVMCGMLFARYLLTL